MGLVLSAARRSAARVVSACAAGGIISLSSQRSPRGFAAWSDSGAGPRRAYLLLRAGLLMSVGRVAKAEADLAEAERRSQNRGASALRSVIALVRDRKDDALRLAEPGAGPDPNSPSLRPRWSYAHQGRFEIEKALEHAKRAVELAPEDALLWAARVGARVVRGDLDAALEAPRRPRPEPALARTRPYWASPI